MQEVTEPAFFETNWSALEVAGPDAAAFLHNLSTNDIKRLADGDCCETLFTDVKAHVLAHAIICREGGSFLVVVTSSHIDALAKHLDRYHITEKLELRAHDDFRATLSFGRRPVSIKSYLVRGLQDEGAQNVWLTFTAPTELPGDPLTEDVFGAMRVEHRFPLDRVDCDQRNLPQELGRDAELISFTKGCYLGQETVARIDALGRVNQQLVRLRFEEASPEVGEDLTHGGKNVGRLTSIVRDRLIGLGYVRREHIKSGTTLETSCGNAVVL